jgi:drug/metabolite transporter (DMT)-like permease
VPAPVASLVTALVPLVLLVLAALFLAEPLTGRKVAAFSIALAGLATIAVSHRVIATGAGGGGARASALGYAGLLGVTALAPLCWSVFSVLSKPVTAEASPLDWTSLTLGLGSLPLVAALPWRGGRELAALDGAGWGALLYLSILCTVVGYAVWSALLRRLPASTVGFFTFLNPPLTAASKWALAVALPATFAWDVAPLELAGAGLALAGLALALAPSRSTGAVPESG